MNKKDKFPRLAVGAFIVTGLGACPLDIVAGDTDVFSVNEKPPMQRCYWLSRHLPAEGLCGEKMRPNLETLKQEAEQGNNIAAMRLGQLYGTGNWGIGQDFEKALKWYKHGAKLGDRYSQLQLAQAFEFGRLGVQPDVRLAIAYYKMATENGIYPDLEERILELEKSLSGTE